MTREAVWGVTVELRAIRKHAFIPSVGVPLLDLAMIPKVRSVRLWSHR
jgi:hypothetical protein